MSGVYILQNKDGYRVSFSKDFAKMFTTYNDERMDWNLNTELIEEVFGNCYVFNEESEAFQYAKRISYYMNDETEDGIFFIKQAKLLSFNDMINGNKIT